MVTMANFTPDDRDAKKENKE